MKDAATERGMLIVVSAPSGTGKSTVCLGLVAARQEVEVSISYTTRAPRGDERNGVEYHFVDDERFDAMIDAGEFLEWAPVFERRYGTARADVDALLAAGKDVLFDIDVQGGQQIKQLVPEALLVYLLPPSIDELVRRLTDRGTESQEQVAHRLETAIWELEQGPAYDCHLVNLDVQKTIMTLDLVRQLDLPEVQKRREDELLSGLIAEARSRLLATI